MSFCPLVATDPFSCSLSFLHLSFFIFSFVSHIIVFLSHGIIAGWLSRKEGNSLWKEEKQSNKIGNRFFLRMLVGFCSNSDMIGQNSLLRYLCKDLSLLKRLLTNVTYQKVTCTCHNMFLLFLFPELLIPIILDLSFTLLLFQEMNPKLFIWLESPKQVSEEALLGVPVEWITSCILNRLCRLFPSSFC